MRLQRAWEHALGSQVAASGKKLGVAWFDALALDESEVDGLMFEVNSRRGK